MGTVGFSRVDRFHALPSANAEVVSTFSARTGDNVGDSAAREVQSDIGRRSLVRIESMEIDLPRAIGHGVQVQSVLTSWPSESPIQERGRWKDLLDGASVSLHPPTVGMSARKKNNRLAEATQVPARQELTREALDPKNGATLDELRRQRPQMQLLEIPHAVLETQPERALTLDRTCLQGSPFGVAPGGGCTNGMLCAQP